jgi:hypothetical protein
MPYSGESSFKIAQRATMALLRDRIHAHWNNKSSQLQKFQQLEKFLRSSISSSDQERVLTAGEGSFRNIWNKQKWIHIHKLYMLKGLREKVGSGPPSGSKILSLISERTFLQTTRSQSLGIAWTLPQ